MNSKACPTYDDIVRSAKEWLMLGEQYYFEDPRSEGIVRVLLARIATLEAALRSARLVAGDWTDGSARVFNEVIRKQVRQHNAALDEVLAGQPDGGQT